MNLLPTTTARYGANYDLGWIGFVHHHTFISDGIDWFTRWYRKVHDPAVSHVFVVSGDNQCLEANANGVDHDSLDQYFLDPRYTVYLRKPFQWTPDLGLRIVKAASCFVGFPYDFDLIAADAISNSIIGHIANQLSHDELDKWLTKAADSPKEMICDKVAALAMSEQPELAGLGTLAMPAARNNPQMLFEDERIFFNNVTVIRAQKTPR